MRIKVWFFYIVTDSILLLEIDVLSQLICIEVDVLFTISQVLRVWCNG